MTALEGFALGVLAMGLLEMAHTWSKHGRTRWKPRRWVVHGSCERCGRGVGKSLQVSDPRVDVSYHLDMTRRLLRKEHADSGCQGKLLNIIETEITR